MTLSQPEEFSRGNILGMIRETAKLEDYPVAASHELKVRLAMTLCEEVFPGLEPPMPADIEAALVKQKLDTHLTAEHVVAGWYMYHFEENDPTYDVLSRFDLTANELPDDTLLAQVIREYVADMESLLKDIEDDPDLTDDFFHTQQYVKLARKMTPADVQHTMTVCRKFGIPPFLLVHGS